MNSASHIITEICCTPPSYLLRSYVILIVAIIIITCRDPLSGPILNFPENVRKTTNPSQIYQSQLHCDWKRMSNPVTIHRIVNQIFQNYSLQFYWYLSIIDQNYQLRVIMKLAPSVWRCCIATSFSLSPLQVIWFKCCFAKQSASKVLEESLKWK